jgi:glycosyltransferase involved in cell wall biosynthesis
VTASVSVIVPVLDMAGTIGACLDALTAQSLPQRQHEIIVVDNGSTDGTRDVVRRYPVTLLYEPERGAPRARNRGVAAAAGDLVAFTDADCVPSRRWLQQIVDAASEPGVDVVAGPLAVLDPARSLIARYSAMLAQYDPSLTLSHPRYPYAVTANVAIQRQRILDAGGFDPSFPTFDSADLFWRMRRQQRLCWRYERRAIVFYRTRSSVAAFVRQNFGYGEGVGRYCRRVAAHEHDPPRPWLLMKSAGRRLAAVRQLAGAGESLRVTTGLVGLHLLRETAIAAGALRAGFGRRP